MTNETNDLKGRSFLKELDFTVEEWLSLLDLSRDLKSEWRAGSGSRHLEGTNIALIFEKASTRTRCAFEVAAHHQGAPPQHPGLEPGAAPGRGAGAGDGVVPVAEQVPGDLASHASRSPLRRSAHSRP